MLDVVVAKFDSELNSPTDEDIANFIKGIDKEKPVQLLLTGSVNVSAKSIESLLTAILDGRISQIQTNNAWFQQDVFRAIPRGIGKADVSKNRTRLMLNRKGYCETIPFGTTLPPTREVLLPEGTGQKTVYWENALSLADMFSKARQVREQLQSPPNKTGSFSFLMPEEKIPAAIMLSSMLTQELEDDISVRDQFSDNPQKPIVLDSTVAAHKKITPVPVSYYDGFYRITVDKDFSRQELGEILGVDASRREYKRETSNDGHHYISIPEADLNQALGLSEGAVRQRA
jgi:hypothetical protein